MNPYKGPSNRRKVLIILIVRVKCSILCTHIEAILDDGWSWRAWWSRWAWWPLMKKAALTLLLHTHAKRFLTAVFGITLVGSVTFNHSVFDFMAFT